MRSILKHPHLSDLNFHQCPEPFPFATCATVEVSPHVHFPPTPTLTSTFITHSSSVYDRTPAEVLPNICALPGRHERELTDTSHPRRARRMWGDREDCQASYFYPRRSETSSTEPSESDDSDAVRTPPEPLMPAQIAVRFGYRHADAMLPYDPQEKLESPLLFLPHPSGMPLKVQKASRRSHQQCRTHLKESRQECADGRIPRQSDFAVPTLEFEGCLGGF